MTLETYRSLVGQEVGVSKWILLDQDRINRFADATDDNQFFHVDPERARATPYRGTIAHGFLTLSMLSAMAFEVQPRLKDRVMAMNYGFDRVRWAAPVRAGSSIRGRFALHEIVDCGPNEIIAKTQVTVEVEGGEKPALVVDWLGYSRFASV
jgi:acyl dehydratase